MGQSDPRALGESLAKSAGAPATAKLIGRSDVCYDDIFESAIGEVGMGAFVENVLKGPPEWAEAAVLSHSLRTAHPELKAHREALLEHAARVKASPMAEAVASAAPVIKLPQNWPPVDNPGEGGLRNWGTVRYMQLHDAASCNVYFTVKWVHNGALYPDSGSKADRDWSNWTWSNNVSQGQTTQKLDIAKVAFSDAPISDGDFVFMYCHQQAGNSEPNNGGNIAGGTEAIWWTYDASSTATAQMVVHGTVDAASLSIKG